MARVLIEERSFECAFFFGAAFMAFDCLAASIFFGAAFMAFDCLAASICFGTPFIAFNSFFMATLAKDLNAIVNLKLLES